MSTTTELWRHQLGQWAIPQEIIDAAPEARWTFPTDLFARAAEAAVAPGAPRGPSYHRALEVLDEPGTVLYVGGAAAAFFFVVRVRQARADRRHRALSRRASLWRPRLLG